MSQLSIRKHAGQFIETLSTHVEAIGFIREHKLWIGFWKYGWVSRFLVLLALLITIKFISIAIESFTLAHEEETNNAIAEMGFFAKNLAFESYDFMFSGGLKYAILLLLEVIIFHICRRTLEILSGSAHDLTFNSFIKAQIRMFKIAIRCYVFEMILTVIIKAFFGIFGFIEFLEPILIYGVQSYFLGMLVFDNYTEQFEYSIKESMKLGKQYVGLLLATGLILNILFLIPGIGTILGPLIAAVAITLMMYRHSGLQDIPLAKVEASVPKESA